MSAPSFAPGAEFRAPFRAMTRERMRWYCDALDTAVENDGVFRIAGPTIHNDDEFAKAQGLSAIIADGMISTNWIYGFMLDTFGSAVLERGELATKYIRPVYEDQRVRPCLRVAAADDAGDSTVRYGLEVWCEDDAGAVLTVGTAAVYLPGPQAA
ncbi:MaoC family dehydratase [Limobrevibacterium gyesilva]|uniref:MaoC family dehydratase n=1 Tax=Limobrevibacterium gyesilva TaxID=2991712 RepID=A0AA42CG05_9PROT|nr:MaoC family dehydratase [Limobrevibacterium gyesilva]MCW3477214.1 MaoC family dehydratase [Limobrevibacterium gyesilva]